MERQKNSYVIMPKSRQILEEMGLNIRKARLRRKISAKLVCERANISRTTLWKIENGDPTVVIGAYVKVLAAINLQNDLLLVAKDEALAEFMADYELEKKWKRSNAEQI